MCIVTRDTAKALRAAQHAVLRKGYSLKVYDCYRPQRAVDHFVAWAKDLDDERMKAEFYPRVEKDRLFEDGYIAEKSGHSRGSTVDLTLVRLPAMPTRPYRPGEPLFSCFAPKDERFPDNSIDMGTGYDCFDTLSHTLDPRIKGEQRANRHAAEEHSGEGRVHQSPRGVVALHAQATRRSRTPSSTSPSGAGRSTGTDPEPGRRAPDDRRPMTDDGWPLTDDR